MEDYDFLDEDELLPDGVLDRLAAELSDGCSYCEMRDRGDSFFLEAE
jgi:hypothetical protein